MKLGIFYLLIAAIFAVTLAALYVADERRRERAEFCWQRAIFWEQVLPATEREKLLLETCHE